jgi:hypothetical protein
MELMRSEVESKVYNLEFYRTKVEKVEDLNSFLGALLARKIDVLRLKVNATDEDVFGRLNRMGVPYQLYNMMYTNHVQIEELPEAAFQVPQDYSCEPFDPSKMGRMKDMVVRTINKKTWVNYSSDIIGDRITDELELRASQEYGCSFYAEDGSKASWIIRYKEEDIGFFMGQKSGEGFYGTFYGILPDHRNHEHSKVVYMMMLDICREKGYSFFVNDIGVMNIPSQRSASSQRMVPTDIYFHFELYPMLSLRQQEEFVSEGVLEFNRISDVLKGKQISRILNSEGLIDSEINRYESRLVVSNDKTTLVVSKCRDDSGHLLGLKYTQWR